jgi:probable addiction module antidote protein
MPKETFSNFDIAKLLEDEEDIAGYIQAVMEDGGDDPATITQALGVVARARNMSQLAREVGISREGLYTALSGEGNPSFATVVKVAKAMGLRIAFHPV